MDLTVPGLGRDVTLVADVAARVPINLIASTGWYTPNVLPTFFQFHGPGRVIDRVDPLIELFVRDLTEGIAGTRVRAGMLKVMTDVDGITPDVARVMTAAAVAHQRDRRADHDALAPRVAQRPHPAGVPGPARRPS